METAQRRRIHHHAYDMTRSSHAQELPPANPGIQPLTLAVPQVPDGPGAEKDTRKISEIDPLIFSPHWALCPSIGTPTLLIPGWITLWGCGLPAVVTGLWAAPPCLTFRSVISVRLVRGGVWPSNHGQGPGSDRGQ